MQVEIWSDIVCPWCYIGKRRFERALAAYDGRDEVSVRYRSFELAPGRAPSVEETLPEMLAAKYGVSLEQAQTMNDRVTTVAAGEGLDYHLDLARPGNTFDAHRVTHLAAEVGIQERVVERLHAGYFTQGAAIGDHEVLVGLAADAGLDAVAVRQALQGDRYAGDVRSDELTADQLGITGVPFFVFDRRYGVSGAQGADVLLGALEQARHEVAVGPVS
jgi:predicted DsbA family dithiol-disulfide isomerase